MRRGCLANKRIKKVHSNIGSERIIKRIYTDENNARQRNFLTSVKGEIHVKRSNGYTGTNQS